MTWTVQMYIMDLGVIGGTLILLLDDSDHLTFLPSLNPETIKPIRRSEERYTLLLRRQNKQKKDFVLYLTLDT